MRVGRQRRALPAEVWSIDVETTGLGERARMVEVAAVLSREGAIVAQWSASIGDRDEPGHVDVGAALRELSARVGAAPAVMHNAGFDLRVLSVEAQRAGVANPVQRSYCTRALARRVVVGVAAYDLGSVARALGLDCVIEHRALPDALVTARVYEKLRGM